MTDLNTPNKKPEVQSHPNLDHPAGVTLSPMQQAQMAMIVKLAIDNSKINIDQKPKEETGVLVDDIEELWACTDETLKNNACVLINKFRISSKPMACNEMHLRINVFIENYNIELFLQQKKRMLYFQQEKTIICNQRLKR